MRVASQAFLSSSSLVAVAFVGCAIAPASPTEGATPDPRGAAFQHLGGSLSSEAALEDLLAPGSGVATCAAEDSFAEEFVSRHRHTESAEQTAPVTFLGRNEDGALHLRDASAQDHWLATPLTDEAPLAVGEEAVLQLGPDGAVLTNSEGLVLAFVAGNRTIWPSTATTPRVLFGDVEAEYLLRCDETHPHHGQLCPDVVLERYDLLLDGQVLEPGTHRVQIDGRAFRVAVGLIAARNHAREGDGESGGCADAWGSVVDYSLVAE